MKLGDALQTIAKYPERKDFYTDWGSLVEPQQTPEIAALKAEIKRLETQLKEGG